MVTLRADEISNIIRERIEQYNREVKVVNIGIVLQVGDDIARIHDLDEVMPGELVEFEWASLIISGATPILAFVISGVLTPISEGEEKLSSYESRELNAQN